MKKSNLYMITASTHFNNKLMTDYILEVSEVNVNVDKSTVLSTITGDAAKDLISEYLVKEINVIVPEVSQEATGWIGQYFLSLDKNDRGDKIFLLCHSAFGRIREVVAHSMNEAAEKDAKAFGLDWSDGRETKEA